MKHLLWLPYMATTAINIILAVATTLTSYLSARPFVAVPLSAAGAEEEAAELRQALAETEEALAQLQAQYSDISARFAALLAAVASTEAAISGSKDGVNADIPSFWGEGNLPQEEDELVFADEPQHPDWSDPNLWG